MTNALGTRILDHLAVVDNERLGREAQSGLEGAVAALKLYQQARFARTHADLLADRRYGPAANFFLEELYGPRDFTQRDAQFKRIVPALVHVFPEDIVTTVEALAAVHALSEGLDTSMARHVGTAPPARVPYVLAWQATGAPQARVRQLELVMTVGRALDRHTRSRLLRASLKAMRAPARAAGLAALQTFLEEGFEAFAAMGGAKEFLATIERRETALAHRLFDADAPAAAAGALRPDDPLAQLP